VLFIVSIKLFIHSFFSPTQVPPIAESNETLEAHVSQNKPSIAVGETMPQEFKADAFRMPHN